MEHRGGSEERRGGCVCRLGRVPGEAGRGAGTGCGPGEACQVLALPDRKPPEGSRQGWT